MSDQDRIMILRKALKDLKEKMQEAKLTPEDTAHGQEYIDGHNHAIDRMQLHILNALNSTH